MTLARGPVGPKPMSNKWKKQRQTVLFFQDVQQKMEEGGKQGHNMTKVVGEIFFKDGGYLNMFVSQ